jgi:hypothetical protein
MQGFVITNNAGAIQAAGGEVPAAALERAARVDEAARAFGAGDDTSEEEL